MYDKLFLRNEISTTQDNINRIRTELNQAGLKTKETKDLAEAYLLLIQSRKILLEELNEE
jgi:hypothetical protein